MNKNILLKIKAGVTIIVLILAFFVASVKPADAAVSILASVPDTINKVLKKIEDFAAKSWKTFGAKLVGTTVRNTLNRVALDAAKYVATAGEGQKPTFITEDFGTYWKNIGDAAAGDFIDGLNKGWGVDLCTPPSADIQAKISLGLVQTLAPDAPNCTLSNLVNNYSSAYEKYAAMESGDYLKGIKVSFDPGGSELGGAFTLFGRTFATSTKASEDEKTKNTITEGWLDVRNIAGKLKGTPGESKETLATAKNTQAQSLLTTTGDALVDAANTFLNQLAYEGFQRVMREIGKGKSTSVPLDISKLTSSGFESLIQYGESMVSEKLASVIKPRFDIRSDYSILSDLATCADKDNPGPTNCVIDDKFSQAISEKLTIGEALAKGYLHGDWLISGDSKSDNTYTLRSANILRKYRIVSVGWEQAILEASSKGYRATLEDLVACFSGTDSRDEFSENFDIGNQDWCRGLVDPNWVLKAPLNSCVKQGSGNQLLSSVVSKDADGIDILSISRATNYCADDQTCIKEKIDGSCEVYGYCNEEKRTWKFNSDSCEPVYNTCRTFTNTTDKQTGSFLENTLDYKDCDASNSGCRQYSYNGSYSAVTNSITWNKNYGIFFNNKIASCDPSSEGCTQLLRGKPGWADVNYIMNANFNLNKVDDKLGSLNWYWPIQGGSGSIIDTGNGLALKINGGNGVNLYSNNTNNLLPKNLEPISGWSYTLSADIKINSGTRVSLIFVDASKKVETTASDWTTISVSVNGADIDKLDFQIVGYGGAVDFSIRNLKLTPNNYYTGYSGFASFPVYEKLLPDYLENSCYNSTSGAGDYTIKDNAPAVCGNFARKCNKSEVGCELFSAVKDIFSVAAKANVSDYCDASCVGYNTYIAKASYFYSNSADNIIPNNMTACSAESVGCASFTNLDAVAQGGESIEYYTKIQQCIKPDTSSCGDFYSWDNAQLKALSLKKNTSGNPYSVNSSLDADCTKETYNLPIDNPKYNPDCREFYSKTGQITYHLVSNVVTCSDNCHAYRLNEKNVDGACQNGGVWDTSQKACIYNVIPEEGTTCSAESVGCREYNGNNGANLKLVASYDFESGVSGFYSLVGGGLVSQSPESTVKNGHSLNVAGNVAVDASSFAKKGSAYVIKFMAKSIGPVATANISLENSEGEASLFGADTDNPTGSFSVKNDSKWHIYELNLSNLDHEIVSEALKIKTNNNFVIDNLIISEISDRYYLIKGSGTVPRECFLDMSDEYAGPNHNLGCAAYRDRDKSIHNLRQFSELCQNSAVGCELMVQTNNSNSQYARTVNLNSSSQTEACSGTNGCIKVDGTKAIYAVFDASKQCNKADAGCTRFGYLNNLANNNSWQDVFKKNLPDTYSSETASPVCRSSEVGCSSWMYDNGSASYFKTPGSNTCIFRNGEWYKTPVKRCDLDKSGFINGTEQAGLICSLDSDCGDKKCITDANDYLCDVVYDKTVGLGGAKGYVATPNGPYPGGGGPVGLCNAESSGCGEYIDPVSKYVNNLVSNPIAQTIAGTPHDKWYQKGGGVYTQTIKLTPNKLYILEVDGAFSGSVTLDHFVIIKDSALTTKVMTLGYDNKLGSLSESVSLSDVIKGKVDSIIFHSGVNNYVTVNRLGVTNNIDEPAASISVKEAIINYQLSANIDTASCNGLVNTDAGCILFNSRTTGKNGLKMNIFNATNVADGEAPATCTASTGNCNANTIIKVSPDRVCSRWLSCQTYTEDPVTKERTCYKSGECDILNEKNECGNFLPTSTTARDIKTDQSNKNATGYALLSNWYLGSMKEVGQNTDAHFDFESNSTNLSCRRDVGVDSSHNNLQGFATSKCVFDKNINDSLVLTPTSATTDYPAHGKGFLKVLNYYQISPISNESSIQIYTNQDYYINYLVNTKGSSAKAKLMITDSPKTGTPVVKFTATTAAPNGWERKVEKFNIRSGDGKKKESLAIKIYLTSNATDLTTGYVYFDDINIEPVLQTGTDSYVAKDCRLYPSDDSLSCLSANNNVIKDGLFGYCLQYDVLNPGVCLMWYPIDKISPITRNSQSVMGYSGKFPLNYCTEVSGGFEVVNKKEPFLIKSTYKEEKCDAIDYGENLNGFHDSNGTYAVCGSQYVGFAYKFYYNRDKNNWFDGIARYVCNIDYWCVPRQDKLEVAVEMGRDGVFSASDAYLYQQSNKPGPFISSLYKGGLVTADAVISVNGEPVQDENNGELQLRISTKGAWNVYSDVFNKGDKTDIRIYDYDNPSGVEENLKYISNPDPEKVYRFTCNKFSKFVDDSGDNMAWSGRISRSSIYPTSTPDFFKQSVTGLQLFGRNREDVPFGAAVLPSGYDLSNSGPILLRNQYSKKLSETLFAGRPYGCAGKNCSQVGQCSLDPNVFCIFSLTDQELNKKSCSAGGAGTCTPLWMNIKDIKNPPPIPTETNAIATLNQLFVKKFSDLKYSAGDNGYVSYTSLAPFKKSSDMGTMTSPHTVGPSGSILKNLPVIRNEKLTLVGAATALNITSGVVNTDSAGLYKLTFNSVIDPEQQPLKQIVVDWGDDSIQVITGLDNRPENGTPHELFHFYLKGMGRRLEIKVIDNWEAWKCSAMSGNSWGGTCNSIN